ncbi:MAG: hypothetical protein WBA76_18175 [Phormidesmis sp.]
MQNVLEKSALSSRVKIVSTVLVFGGMVLCVWQALATLPPFLQPVFSVVQVALFIHGVEGAIAAILIFLYWQRIQKFFESDLPNQTSFLLTDHLPTNLPLAVVKSGLHTFFVGTVGLLEVVKAVRQFSEKA